MGYWISHHIKATGSKENIDAYISKLTQRRPKELNDEGDIVWSEEEFSFYNIISPPEEMIMDGSWWDKPGKDWRTEHWECYDAPLEGFIDVYNDGISTTARMSMSTKYDWPNDIFHELIAQYPNLDFYIWSEGEESEAVEITGHNGTFTQVEHARPESHADWVARDDVDSCYCSHYDDPNDWFEDCPKEGVTDTYEVIVQVKHIVKAYSQDKAIEALEAYEIGFDMPYDTQVIKYADTTTYNAKEVNEE